MKEIKQRKTGLAWWLQAVGSIILVVLVFVCIPFSVPRLFGCQLYEVISGSMEPEYPVGSVIYVMDVSPQEIQVGDVITFSIEGQEQVLTHRVVQIDNENQQFITKGDKNEQEDINPVPFSRLVGKPVFCLKNVSFMAYLFQNRMGWISLGTCIVFSIVLLTISDCLYKKNVVRVPEDEK